MKKIFLAFAVLLLTSTHLSAQRPWILCTWPDVGTNPHLALASGALIIYDSSVASSYDHGATWQPEPEMADAVRGVTDFGAVAGSVIVTQREVGSLVRAYLSQNGTNWTQFDSADIGNRLVVGVGAVGNNYFLATNSNAILVKGASNSEIIVSETAGTTISDFVATPNCLAVITTEGLLVSSDNGTTWKEARPGGNMPPSTTVFELSVVEGTVYASSDFGVIKIDPSVPETLPVGTWPLEMGVPVTSAVSGDALNLITLTNVDNHRQMYRLPSADTAWVEAAYPLPGTNPSLVSKSLIVDAGWAVTYHQPVETDSIGVYRFDLNDFSDVEDDDPMFSNVKISGTEYGLFISGVDEFHGTVTLCDMVGRAIHNTTKQVGQSAIQLPEMLRGVSGVILTLENGKSTRRMIVR